MSNKTITIGGIMYPNQEWYNQNILAKGKKAVGGKEIRVLPDEAPVTGDLEHTLPPEEAEPMIGGLGLPADGKVDKLTLLGLALKNISRKALEKRKASATFGMIGTAGAAMGKFEKMGFDPSRMPGGFSGRIISMARQKAAEQLAKGKGEITQQFDTLETILGSIKESTEREQDLARQNLGILMQTRSLSTLGDKELENLSNVAGVPLEQLTAIKNAESADKTMLNAYKEMVETGKLKIESIPAEFRSDVVKILDVGNIPEGEEEGGAIVNLESGAQVDLTTPDGLKQAMAEGHSYAYLKGWLDVETKLSNVSIDGLLKEAGGVSSKEIEEKEAEKKEKAKMNYDVSFLTTQAKNALKIDYNKSVNDFIFGLKSKLKDLTDRDIETAKKLYSQEQEIVKGLGWYAKKQYFK